MNVVIIEDEYATAQHMRKMIEALEPDAAVAAILDSIESSVQWFRTHPEPDLLLLDIHLADGVSFEIFKEVEVHCPVVFTTAYDQYAIQAFRLNSIDYLLKPVGREALEGALKKYRTMTSRASLPSIDYRKLAALLTEEAPERLKRIVIRFGDTIKPIDIRDAAYFYTDEKIVFVRTFANNAYPVDFTLDDLEKQLDPARWFRINRQFLVSFDSIDKMTTWSKSRVKLSLRPPSELEAVSSTERSGDFKQWLAGK